MGLSDIARSIEANVNRRGIVKRRNEGWLPELIGYASYGSTTSLRVMARAIMTEPGKSRRRTPYRTRGMHTIVELAAVTTQEAQRGWRQFFTTQVGFLPVTVEVGTKTIETRTDRSGYVDFVVDDHGLEPGWHDIRITPAAGEAITTPVMIVKPTTTHGVVSDIDDTIVVTWLPRMLLAAYNSFFLQTNARREVPGMASFLNALVADDPDAPVFYLSTGAWNTQPALMEFIGRHGFPMGPMLMTDWGPTPTGMFRSGQEHKKTQLRNLLIMFPEIDWILVGDDGQHDPLIFDDLAREHPSRVAGIALRELNTVEQVLSHGTIEATEAQREDLDLERHGIPVIRGRDGEALLEKISHLR